MILKICYFIFVSLHCIIKVSRCQDSWRGHLIDLPKNGTMIVDYLGKKEYDHFLYLGALLMFGNLVMAGMVMTRCHMLVLHVL